MSAPRPWFGPMHHNAVAKVLREVRQTYPKRADTDVVDNVAAALAAYFSNDNENFTGEAVVRYFRSVAQERTA